MRQAFAGEKTRALVAVVHAVALVVRFALVFRDAFFFALVLAAVFFFALVLKVVVVRVAFFVLRFDQRLVVFVLFVVRRAAVRREVLRRAVRREVRVFTRVGIFTSPLVGDTVARLGSCSAMPHATLDVRADGPIVLTLTFPTIGAITRPIQGNCPQGPNIFRLPALLEGEPGRRFIDESR